jgi:uncharacterized membrane protein (DUF2068 family)
MLLLIALFKLVKGVSLIILGVGALKLLRGDVAKTVAHWVDILRVDPENKYIHMAISKIMAISPQELRVASVGTFVYAALLLTEGVGLLYKKRWAEYFTIITTTGLIPLELYEIALEVTWPKIGILTANIVIVLYLVHRVRQGK